MAKARRIVWLIGIAVGIQAAGMAASEQSHSQSLRLADGSPQEFFSGKEAEVGGGTIVGVLTERQIRNPLEFWVWAPAASDTGQLCLNIKSQSGSYIAVANYSRKPTDTTGPRHLPYKSEYRDYLEGLKARELAPLIEASACDDVIDGPYLVGTRGSSLSTRPEEITVMINSRGSDFVEVEITAGDEDRPNGGRCDPLPAGKRLGFDTICEVALFPGHDQQTLTVNTIGFHGIPNRPIRAEILVPK